MNSKTVKNVMLILNTIKKTENYSMDEVNCNFKLKPQVNVFLKQVAPHFSS